MNDRGIAFSGNKKISTITGKEEIFDSPVRTVTGEDISNKSGYQSCQCNRSNIYSINSC